jgi:mono/diheme cytochrome c family protein
LFGREIQPELGPQLTEETWENAQLYAEVIQPILNKNCKSCHNPRNRKGELDLTSFGALRKGGEEGMVLTAGDAAHSALFARLLLPKEDEKHMPPAEKNQPSEEEIALIESWIQGGAKESGTLAAAGISRNQIERFILKNEVPFYPTSALAPLAADSLAVLKEAGLFAEAVESGSGLLKVSCINLPTFQDSDWKILASVQSRIAYLDLSGTQVTDAVVEELAALPNLTVLKLNSTKIAGNSLKKLAQLNHLKWLYLNKTGVSLSQLQALGVSKSLQKVFAFDTPASSELGATSKASFPFILEAGSYSLPKLPTDSIVY